MRSNISGYVFSYMHPSGQERLDFRTFGVSKTKAKRNLAGHNYHSAVDRKIVPIAIHSVNVIVNSKEDKSCGNCVYWAGSEASCGFGRCMNDGQYQYLSGLPDRLVTNEKFGCNKWMVKP